jgi:hypothetical protein
MLASTRSSVDGASVDEGKRRWGMPDEEPAAAGSHRISYARDTIAMAAAGFKYDKLHGAVRTDYGLSADQGVIVTASKVDNMPAGSVILTVDNVRITRGVRQMHELLAAKSLGDELVLCGMKHEYQACRSVWEQEFVSRTAVKPIAVNMQPSAGRKNSKTHVRKEPLGPSRQEQLENLVGDWTAPYNCPDGGAS